MKLLLTAREVKKIKASQAFEAQIDKIIEAYAKALNDFIKNNGYKNKYTMKSQEVAYDIGWNKCVNFYHQAEGGCTYTYDSLCGCQR